MNTIFSNAILAAVMIFAAVSWVHDASGEIEDKTMGGESGLIGSREAREYLERLEF